MVIFDCERLKHPNTGLYHYTFELANALAEEASARGDDRLMFYAYKYRKELLDKRIPVKQVGMFDRALLYDSRIHLWHSSSQWSHYQPINGKKILTIHDLNYLYEDITPFEKKIAVTRLKKNLKRCSAIIAISEFVKNDIQTQLDVDDLPIEVIYNGCNHYNGPISEPSHKPDGEFLFAVGSVVPKKNFHVLPALLVGNDLRLIIAGIIDSDDYRQKIIAEAKKHGVADRLFIIGPVSESDKHWYLRNCVAFLHPSIAEGFGLPVLEAMHYGKPTFISQHTSLPEVGGDKAYYFDREFDADKMRAEFEAGMNDFAEGGISPDDIIKHADSFSWQEAARHHFEFYDRLLRR